MTQNDERFDLEKRVQNARQTSQDAPGPRLIPKEARPYVQNERRLKIAALDAIRNDPDLRVAMVRMIPRLYDLIDEIAYEGIADPFAADRLAQRIVWQLAEFLGQSLEDEPARVVRAHQLTEDHAAAWWEVDFILSGGERRPVVKDDPAMSGGAAEDHDLS